MSPPSVKTKRQNKKCNKPHPLLSKGNKVEVKSDEEGFRGVWYESTIVKPPPMSSYGKKKGKVLVQYDTLLAVDGVSALKEYVCPTFIRPLPPKHDGNVSPCFEVYDVVDAYHLDGWWKGVVSSVREVNGVKKYMVVFQTPPHQIEFCGEDLRAHWDWIREDWVKAPKEYRMKGLEFRKGMTVEVNLCKGMPKFAWFQAVILEEDGFNSFLVKFSGQGNNNEGRKRAVVDSFHIRPPHPIFKAKEFELLDKVCVFHGLARKEGFITNILTDGSYVVYLKGEKSTKKVTESKLMPYLQFVNGKWIDRHCKDGSLISTCQGQDDILVNSKERSPVVTIQLDCASSENTQVVEQNPCGNSCTNQLNYSTIFNSKFKKARSRACRRKTTITLPCQKFKGEKSAKLSSSGECHEKSTPQTPLEQSNGENSTSCMLAKCSSNSVAEKNPSVESTIPDSTKETHEEEAMMEDNMMTFTEKSEAPQDLELEVQQVSASGNRVNTKDVCSETFAPPPPVDHMETDCLLNTRGTEFVDQPRLLRSEGGEDNGKGVLGETLAPQLSTDCMAEEVNMDASLVSSCRGKSDHLVDNKERKTDVAIQLESASSLNNQVQEKSPCTNSCENPLNYSAALNSEFMNGKRRACEGKAESSSPCKKLRGENYATCSSSEESHEKSTPIEQLNGEKITYCMLPKYSCNPVVDKFHSIESTSPINSGTNEEEATMEDDMMTSVDKSGVPENSELKSQHISASGGDEITAECMATSSLENSCGIVILDQPQDLCSEGKKDNRKGVSEEMLTPQFSADFIAGVDVVYVGTNHLVKSGGMLMDDHCQFLCSEETSAPLVTTHCMEKIVTDDVVAECISESCGISNVHQFQLCLEGGKSDRKIKSAETSTPFSATDCMTKEADIVDIATDCVENSNGPSGFHQPQFLFLEGHNPCNTQNQCADAIDGQSVPGMESPVRSVEVNNEPVENVEMPFIKNPRLWRLVDSLEIFKLMPQKPHFRPLMNLGEVFREGFALGYMMTFSNVVDKISDLQVTDSQGKFDNFLETLAELEMHGFKVKPLVDRVNVLLSMKDEHRQLEDQSKEVKAQLADRISEQVRLNASTLAINKVLSELRKERGMYVLLEKNNSRDITILQQDDSSINEGITAAMREFECLVAASW